MAFVEVLQTHPIGNTSAGAAEAVYETLTDHIRQIREAKAGYVFARRGVVRYQLGGVMSDVDVESDEWEADYDKFIKNGGIEEASISRRIADGRVVSAYVASRLPASLTHEEANHLFLGDTTRGRLQLPYDPSLTTQRVVLDSWRNPETKVSKASHIYNGDPTPEEMAEYEKLHKGVFVASPGTCIPSLAEDRLHLVYGREGLLTEVEQAPLVAFMDNLESRVVAAINRTTRVSA